MVKVTKPNIKRGPNTSRARLVVDSPQLVGRVRAVQLSSKARTMAGRLAKLRPKANKNFINYNLILVLLVSNLVSLLLFGLRIVATDSTRYWFLFWNLLLGWLPVLFAWLLVREVGHKSWKRPVPILLSFLWLVFLPNSFYIMSDLIHLQSRGDIGILFDSALFLSCIWNGVLAGMLSLVWVHRSVLKRRSSFFSATLMAFVIGLVSFAIYLGRALRWNTWDVLLNPAGVIFDVSERVINPLDHPQVVVTTLTFFVLLGSMYLVIWHFVQTLQKQSR